MQNEITKYLNKEECGRYFLKREDAIAKMNEVINFIYDHNPVSFKITAEAYHDEIATVRVEYETRVGI